ncbi:EamA family transporter, partial [Neisseria sp. P0015.S004]
MSSNAWLFWALASAGFASLTAIFAKMGLQGIDSDFATFIRTLVILAALVLFLTYTGKWQGVNGFTGRNWTF